MEMTTAILEQMRTDGGGFTKATVEALGFQWGKDIGWHNRCLSMTFTEEQISKAIAGRNTYKAKAPRATGMPRFITEKQTAILLRSGMSAAQICGLTSRQAYMLIQQRIQR